MNTPRLWFSPEDYSQHILGCYETEDCLQSYEFVKGKPLADRSTTPLFKFPALRSVLIHYDILPNTIGIPLISERVAEILRGSCQNEIELIPANILARDTEVAGYFLINALVTISGIDRSESVVKMFPGTNFIMSVHSLKYAKGAMRNHFLARDRDYSPYLWVSDHLAQNFTRKKLKACEFRTPESIRP